MTEEIKELFSDHKRLIVFSRNKKDIYIDREAAFLQRNRTILEDILKDEKTNEEKAEFFTDAVAKTFGRFGRVGATRALDLGFFMLYYVFPGFLETGGEEARPFLDALRDSWNRRFHQNMNYTDKAEIIGSFHDTFLGFNVPDKDS